MDLHKSCHSTNQEWLSRMHSSISTNLVNYGYPQMHLWISVNILWRSTNTFRFTYQDAFMDIHNLICGYLQLQLWISTIYLWRSTILLWISTIIYGYHNCIYGSPQFKLWISTIKLWISTILLWLSIIIC